MDELLKNPEVLRQIIMEHYQHPKNHGLSEDGAYKQVHMASISCIDDLHLQIKFAGDKIADLRFDGVACTISTASTSIVGELIKGQTIDDAQKIIDEYYKMIKQEVFDEELLQEAYAFHAVGKQANRIKCATIGIDGFRQLLEEQKRDK